MKNRDIRSRNEEVRRAWDENADYWDDYMGEGNDFVEVLCWPSIRRLLDLKPRAKVLDIACGNGLTSRRLAALGYEVTAFDFSTKMIENAKKRSTDYQSRIRYLVIDATDEGGLRSLGKRKFEAAISNMALFDMAQIEPLFRSLSNLLVKEGYFVFSVMHPCFNNPFTKLTAEVDDRSGKVVTEYSVRVLKYLSPGIEYGVALRNQPRKQLYFHRPLQELFKAGFDFGFVIDRFEERAFPPDHPSSNSYLTWGANFSEIPPVMVIRMRLSQS